MVDGTHMLGTARLLTDDAGAAIFHSTPLGQTSVQNYTAFGAPFTIWAGTPSYVLPTRYGYAGAWGYESLSELGTQNSELLHVGARHYAPSMGRFLQRDPIGIAGGLNVCAYVRNSPLMYIDPDGSRYRLPGATGPPDRGFLDRFWSKVHYSAGWAAGKAGMSFCATMCAAIRWERWEPDHWPGWRESLLNRIGDVYVAGKGWIDAHLWSAFCAACSHFSNGSTQ